MGPVETVLSQVSGVMPTLWGTEREFCDGNSIAVPVTDKEQEL